MAPALVVRRRFHVKRRIRRTSFPPTATIKRQFESRPLVLSYWVPQGAIFSGMLQCVPDSADRCTRDLKRTFERPGLLGPTSGVRAGIVRLPVLVRVPRETSSQPQDRSGK